MASGRARRRQGATLIELMVALAASGVALAGGAALVSAAHTSLEQARRTAAAIDRRANAQRLLRRTVADMLAGDGADRFSGNMRETRFTSWCDVAAGWREPCSMSLRIEPTGAGPVLTLLAGSDGPVVLMSADSVLELRYLTKVIDGGNWIERWDPSVSLPFGVGLLVDGDTLILPVGSR
jgi:prepilin-type N-terminal cleavage/methylation domain-containing protein